MQDENRLELATGTPIDQIAYPHGAADARVAAAARAAGYKLGLTNQAARISRGCDPMLLGRFAPGRATLGEFALNLARTLLRRHCGPQIRARAGGHGNA